MYRCIRCRIYLGIGFGAMVVEKIDIERTVSVTIRRASPDDLDALQEVENRSYVHPWTRAMLQGSLDNPKSLNYVAEDQSDGAITGFILSLLLMDELHILNIAVLPLCRRQGIGTGLLDASLETAGKAGAVHAFLEVRRSNIQALTLYIKHGFRVTGVRRGYYSDNKEDALLMTRIQRRP